MHQTNFLLNFHYRGLDATGLAGTGKGGRVTKGDVLAAIRDGTPMPALAVVEEKSPTLAGAVEAKPVPNKVLSVPAEDLPLPIRPRSGLQSESS